MSDIHVEETRAHAVEEHAAPHVHHPGAKEYVRIFFILVAITALEVAIYFVRDTLGGWFLPILFGLMFSKFTIVVLWFMHLKFDDRPVRAVLRDGIGRRDHALPGRPHHAQDVPG